MRPCRQIEFRELSSTAVGPEQHQEEAACSGPSQPLPHRFSGKRGLLSWVVRTYASARTQTSLNRAKCLREFATPIIEASVGHGVGFGSAPFSF